MERRGQEQEREVAAQAAKMVHDFQEMERKEEKKEVTNEVDVRILNKWSAKRRKKKSPTKST